jgi:hypothetical protein
MLQWLRMMAASWAWLAWVRVSEVTALQVSRDHVPFTIRQRTIWMACYPAMTGTPPALASAPPRTLPTSWWEPGKDPNRKCIFCHGGGLQSA